MDRNSKLAADICREKAKQQRTFRVGFGVLGVALPAKATVKAEPIDRRPPKHKAGFSERYLGRLYIKKQ